MPDLADQAQSAEALFQAADLAASMKSSLALPANGKCYNCHDRVGKGRRFCDADCRDDYVVRKCAEARLGLTRHG